MDAFLSELLNLGAIVRTLLLFVVTLFIGKAINPYLSYRSVKGIRRRIKYTEYQKLELDNLANTDQFILLYFFIRIFVFITLGCFAFMINPLFSYLEYSSDFTRGGINYVVFSIFAGIAISSAKTAHTLRKLEKYPESIEIINKKIDSLKTRLSKLAE